MKDKIIYDINIEKLRNDSLILLKDITSILDRYKIRYWLDFGTLLGAVRDKRSIPWDGDFDLSTLESERILKNPQLLEDIYSEGYCIDITYGNIKVERRKAEVGYYKLDLHRYRVNEEGEVEYAYGKKYVNKIASKLHNLQDHIYSFIKPKWNERRNYPTYGAICRGLIAAGVEPNEVEKYNIQLKLGPTNNPYDFTIFIEGQPFVMSREIRIGARPKKGVKYTIFMHHPRYLLRFYNYVLTKILNSFKTAPLKTILFPKRFFEVLEVVNFHSYKFYAPRPTEQYLERIYGKSWKEPIATENKSYLNKISKENK